MYTPLLISKSGGKTVSEIHRPASRRTQADHPGIPGGFAGIRIDAAIERLDERDAST
jgi:hypothetical protein